MRTLLALLLGVLLGQISVIVPAHRIVKSAERLADKAIEAQVRAIFSLKRAQENSRPAAYDTADKTTRKQRNRDKIRNGSR